DKASELVESPRMPFVAISSTNRDPLSDACQVFKSDCLASTNSLMYQGFADNVVGVLLKTFLSSAHVFQASFRRARSDLLQRLATFLIAHAYFMNFCTTEGLTLAISSKIDYSEVYSESIRRLYLFRLNFVLGDIQVVNAT